MNNQEVIMRNVPPSTNLIAHRKALEAAGTRSSGSTPTRPRLSRLAERAPLDIVRQEASRDDKDQRAEQ